MLAKRCGWCHPNVHAHVVTDLLASTVNEMMVATVVWGSSVAVHTTLGCARRDSRYIAAGGIGRAGLPGSAIISSEKGVSGLLPCQVPWGVRYLTASS